MTVKDQVSKLKTILIWKDSPAMNNPPKVGETILIDAREKIKDLPKIIEFEVVSVDWMSIIVEEELVLCISIKQK